MNQDIPAELVNLADASLGAAALWANDEFFAAKERMLNPAPPVSKPGTYDAHGQWMDGWETRRRREPGHDACIVKLAYRGAIRVLDLDTHYFTGNYPPQASVDATDDADPLAREARWTTILGRCALGGDRRNRFEVADARPWRALRLNIYPDGGIARLRAWGVVQADWSNVRDDEIVDLFAIERGGAALFANDQHYGDIRNLNRPGRGVNMGDGWETRRRREPGADWVIVKLGHPGTVREVEVDTAHFRPEPAARNGGPPLIASMGRLVRYKGFDRLIRLLGAAARAGSQFRCVIAGDGSQRAELERLIGQLDLRDRVQLVGWLDRASAARLLGEADLFVLAADAGLGQHGLPNVLVEAMSAGCATLASPLAAVRELIENGRNGLLLPDSDTEAAGLLGRVLKDAPLRRQLGAQARETVLARLDLATKSRELADRFDVTLSQPT